MSSFWKYGFSPSFSTVSSTPQAEVIWLTRSIKIISPKVLCFLNSSRTTFSASSISQSAISFFSMDSAGRCSPVFTSTLYWILRINPGILFVPIFTRYSFPKVSLLSSIQRRVAWKLFATGTSALSVSTQPRLTSTSLSSWMVTACPVTASSTVLSPLRRDLTVAVSLLGSVVMVCPTFTLPLSIWPWKPRNS